MTIPDHIKNHPNRKHRWNQTNETAYNQKENSYTDKRELPYDNSQPEFNRDENINGSAH